MQTIGTAGKFPEPPGTSKILKSFWLPENANDIKGHKIASHALDGGSIPLTRSNLFMSGKEVGSTSSFFGTIWATDANLSNPPCALDHRRVKLFINGLDGKGRRRPWPKRAITLVDPTRLRD